MFELLMVLLVITIFVIIGISFCIAHYLLIELPNKQLHIINRFVPCIINQVAMEYSMLSCTQQKQIATEKIEDIFKDLGVYSPYSAIEAAVSGEIGKKANTWIEELKRDCLAERETEQMPVLKEELWIL